MQLSPIQSMKLSFGIAESSGKRPYMQVCLGCQRSSVNAGLSIHSISGVSCLFTLHYICACPQQSCKLPSIYFGKPSSILQLVFKSRFPIWSSASWHLPWGWPLL
jgi:hypothetical protein